MWGSDTSSAMEEARGKLGSMLPNKSSAFLPSLYPRSWSQDILPCIIHMSHPRSQVRGAYCAPTLVAGVAGWL